MTPKAKWHFQILRERVDVYLPFASLFALSRGGDGAHELDPAEELRIGTEGGGGAWVGDAGLHDGEASHVRGGSAGEDNVEAASVDVVGVAV